MQIKLIVSVDGTDGEVTAWTTVNNSFLSTIAADLPGAIANIKMLIEDVKANEWKDDPAWNAIDAEAAQFECEFSMADFFDVYKALKISEVAKLAGMNSALVRAYASGDKNPSLAQAQKIEAAIYRLADSLKSAHIVPKTEPVTA